MAVYVIRANQTVSTAFARTYGRNRMTNKRHTSKELPGVEGNFRRGAAFGVIGGLALWALIILPLGRCSGWW
jgi:hypothetical protein